MFQGKERERGAGMGEAMHFLQLPDADVRVDLRGLEAGVPQLLLHVADVGPVLQH